ncbi:hypothetical protein BC938DRAFT_473251 [Jimgerdemannia flammicorona]|uniref:Uncharacterized protein n=1 Tax=Jimgerdemannia flammicorona TaxID=994334 RepID=A0A433QTE8_9FUNG|nr:hypothetical protein BC938DRAFT_473251 [Jimgerdemannia flammicorona]
MTPQEVIQNIRDRFLIDGSATDAWYLQETTERALQNLSSELYTKDNHFILELLQNADDNNYLSENLPSVCVKWDDSRHTIEIRNNELGFNEDNVRALCNIGHSTKERMRREGYIGEKGIGFKSVFKVADRVFIASNGYSFALDSRRSLGMIAPEWIPPDEFPTDCEDGWTVLYLELKRTGINKDELKKQFDDIHPRLLLFLNKVRSLELDIAGRRQRFKRNDEIVNDISYINIYQDGPEPLSVRHHFLVHEQILNKPDHVDETKRSEVKQTTMMIAFPLDDGEDERASTELQNIFAFLPLRTQAFKFIVQADFLVTASRESVIEGSSWNKFLRDEIADVFIAAAKILKNSEKDPARQTALISYLSLAKDVADPFFQPVADAILNGLCSEDIILSCEGRWCTPDRILYISKFFKWRQKALIPNDDLRQIRDVEYIHEHYKWAEHELLLKKLGCKPFEIEDLLACLRSYDGPTPIDILWHQRVLHCFANGHRKSIDTSPPVSIPPSDITNLNVFVVDDSGLPRKETLSNGCTFFPFHDRSFTAPDFSIKILHRESFTSNSRDFLSWLGVKESRTSVLAHEVLKLYQQYGRRIDSQRSQRELLTHIEFFRRHLGDLSDDQRKRLRKDLVLMKWEGDYQSPEQLYINAKPTQYDLEQIFFSSPLSQLHDQYLLSTNGDTDAQQNWVSFLTTNCGVNRALPLDDEGALPRWIIKKLDVEKDGQFGTAVLVMLSDVWADVYEPFYKRSQRKFCKQLGNMWVPCEGGRTAQLKLTSLRTRELEGVFRRELLYIELQEISGDAEDRDERWSFLKFLGVSVRPEPQTALKVLEVMSGRSEKDITAVEPLYKFLDVHFSEAPDAIRKSFGENPLTIIKEGSVKWKRLDQVLWSGERNIFRNWSFLEDSLPECRSLFNKLKIKSAGVHDLERMIAVLDPQSTDCSLHMAQVYLYLADWFHSHHDHENRTWLASFVKKKVFLVRQGPRRRVVFEKWGSQIYIADHRGLENLFKDDLHILHVPINTIPGMEPFLQFLKPLARRLSGITLQGVEHSLDFTEDKEWTNRVRMCIPLCARIVHSRDVVDMDKFVEKKVFAMAKNNLKVLRAGGIRKMYCTSNVTRSLDADMVVEHNAAHIKIWISSKLDNLKTRQQLINGICEIFGGGDPIFMLKDLLQYALDPAGTLAHCTSFMQENEIPELPSKYKDIFDDFSGVGPSPGVNQDATVPTIVAADSRRDQRPEAPRSPQTVPIIVTPSMANPIRLPRAASPEHPLPRSVPPTLDSGKFSVRSQQDYMPEDDDRELFDRHESPPQSTYGITAPRVVRGQPTEVVYPAPVNLSPTVRKDHPDADDPIALNIGPSRHEAPRPTQHTPIAIPANPQMDRNISTSTPFISPNGTILQTSRNLSTGAPIITPNSAIQRNGLNPQAYDRIPVLEDGAIQRNGLNPQAYDRGSVLEDGFSLASDQPFDSGQPPQTHLRSTIDDRNDQDAREVGYLGERFVYRQYRDVLRLPGFGLANWVSVLRDNYIAETSGERPADLDLTQADREIECDFVYKDVDGVLSREFRMKPTTTPRTFFLEVKSTTAAGGDPFPISVREWDSARRISMERSNTRVYVILRVEHARSEPTIVRELDDPWARWRRGEFVVETGEWLVSRIPWPDRGRNKNNLSTTPVHHSTPSPVASLTSHRICVPIPDNPPCQARASKKTLSGRGRDDVSNQTCDDVPIVRVVYILASSDKAPPMDAPFSLSPAWPRVPPNNRDLRPEMEARDPVAPSCATTPQLTALTDSKTVG